MFQSDQHLWRAQKVSNTSYGQVKFIESCRNEGFVFVVHDSGKICFYSGRITTPLYTFPSMFPEVSALKYLPQHDLIITIETEIEEQQSKQGGKKPALVPVPKSYLCFYLAWQNSDGKPAKYIPSPISDPFSPVTLPFASSSFCCYSLPIPSSMCSLHICDNSVIIGGGSSIVAILLSTSQHILSTELLWSMTLPNDIDERDPTNPMSIYASCSSSSSISDVSLINDILAVCSGSCVYCYHMVRPSSYDFSDVSLPQSTQPPSEVDEDLDIFTMHKSPSYIHSFTPLSLASPYISAEHVFHVSSYAPLNMCVGIDECEHSVRKMQDLLGVSIIQREEEWDEEDEEDLPSHDITSSQKDLMNPTSQSQQNSIVSTFVCIFCGNYISYNVLASQHTLSSSNRSNSLSHTHFSYPLPNSINCVAYLTGMLLCGCNNTILSILPHEKLSICGRKDFPQGSIEEIAICKRDIYIVLKKKESSQSSKATDWVMEASREADIVIAPSLIITWENVRQHVGKKPNESEDDVLNTYKGILSVFMVCLFDNLCKITTEKQISETITHVCGEIIKRESIRERSKTASKSTSSSPTSTSSSIHPHSFLLSSFASLVFLAISSSSSISPFNSLASFSTIPQPLHQTTSTALIRGCLRKFMGISSGSGSTLLPDVVGHVCGISDNPNEDDNKLHQEIDSEESESGSSSYPSISSVSSSVSSHSIHHKSPVQDSNIISNLIESCVSDLFRQENSSHPSISNVHSLPNDLPFIFTLIVICQMGAMVAKRPTTISRLFETVGLYIHPSYYTGLDSSLLSSTHKSDVKHGKESSKSVVSECTQECCENISPIQHIQQCICLISDHCNPSTIFSLINITRVFFTCSITSVSLEHFLNNEGKGLLARKLGECVCMSIHEKVKTISAHSKKSQIPAISQIEPIGSNPVDPIRSFSSSLFMSLVHALSKAAVSTMLDMVHVICDKLIEYIDCRIEDESGRIRSRIQAELLLIIEGLLSILYVHYAHMMPSRLLEILSSTLVTLMKSHKETQELVQVDVPNSLPFSLPQRQLLLGRICRNDDDLRSLVKHYAAVNGPLFKPYVGLGFIYCYYCHISSISPLTCFQVCFSDVLHLPPPSVSHQSSLSSSSSFISPLLPLLMRFSHNTRLQMGSLAVCAVCSVHITQRCVQDLLTVFKETREKIIALSGSEQDLSKCFSSCIRTLSLPPFSLSLGELNDLLEFCDEAETRKIRAERASVLLAGCVSEDEKGIDGLRNCVSVLAEHFHE
ncbi:hypothetical protein ADUPG1_000342 [Aduncisulcus paluster]|uniref:Uncharacterized protein n=1 Tax=Aduncisulcus paluster TaxID=2918883 RepID=A0ABQ5K5Z2_9EUKA|nr:hypothetical protein ADUPG1_000342 [Aduncisulcus paluster]